MTCPKGNSSLRSRIYQLCQSAANGFCYILPAANGFCYILPAANGFCYILPAENSLNRAYFTVTNIPMREAGGQANERADERTDYECLYWMKHFSFSVSCYQCVSSVLVSYVGERPWWSIQCLNKVRKKEAKG